MLGALGSWLTRGLVVLDALDTDTIEGPLHAMAMSVTSATKSFEDLMRSGNTTYNRW
jgi:hypothetical protein